MDTFQKIIHLNINNQNNLPFSTKLKVQLANSVIYHNFEITIKFMNLIQRFKLQIPIWQINLQLSIQIYNFRKSQALANKNTKLNFLHRFLLAQEKRQPQKLQFRQLSMQKSSILSKAGQQSLQNKGITPKIIRKGIQDSKYYKQAISDNLLKEVDGNHKQIKGYESQHINQEGNQIKYNQVGQQSPDLNKNNKVNIDVVRRDINSKNKFVNQPVLQQSQLDKQQLSSNSSVKQLSKLNPLSSPKSSEEQPNHVPSSQSYSRQKPGTLLKNYKMNNLGKMRYQDQLGDVTILKLSNHKKNHENSSYITNANNIKQQDFYKLDYMNTGKYKSQHFNYGNKNMKHGFLQTSNDLDGIEDILSDISSLNKSPQGPQQASNKSSARMSMSSSSISKNKYKGQKNFQSFKGAKGKLGSSFDGLASKLDQLLISYKFSYSDFGSARNAPQLNQQKPEHQGQIGQSQNQLTKSLKFDERSKSQLKRVQRQQRRKQNRFYQQVKNQFKYGYNQQHQSFNSQQNSYQEQQVTENNSNLRGRQVQNQIIEEQSQNEQEQKYDLVYQNESMTWQVAQIAQKIKLYQIDWNQVPLLPGSYNNFYQQLRVYPKFSTQEIQSILGLFFKLYNSKLKTYSIFSFSFSDKAQNEQIFGLRLIVTKNKVKNSQKTFRLLNERQFGQKWRSFFEQAQKEPKSMQNIDSFTPQQIQVLIQFDLKWYKAVTMHAYEKDLFQIQQLYLGQKGEQEPQDVIKTQKYRQAIKKMTTSSNESSLNLSMGQLVTQNKLKLLKGLFQQLDSQSEQYSVGIIPSILNGESLEKEQSLIKFYLKQNFRGGLYYTGTQKSKNICILQMCRNEDLQIRQISNQQKRQVWINEKVVIKLQNQLRNIPPVRNKNALQINLKRIKKQNVKSQLTQILINCYYNQIQYQVQEEEQTSKKTSQFLKKYRILLPVLNS